MLQQISCNSHSSALDEFDVMLSKSNRILIRFNENKNFNEPSTIRMITSSAQIIRLRDLIDKSTEGSGCTYYDGTMTFFSDAEQTGFLQFSVNPQCPAFYFHSANKITQYAMTAYCAMFLEGIRQGQN
jgi:hypothetical protein